jgi:hypothetical protein
MYDKLFSQAGAVKAEQDLPVHEGPYSRLTVLSNHSFLNMDCTTSLQKKIGDKKIFRGRRKCESIVTYVYAAWALGEMTNDPKYVNFVTLPRYVSNRKHVKQLPIVVYVLFSGARFVKLGDE